MKREEILRKAAAISAVTATVLYPLAGLPVQAASLVVQSDVMSRLEVSQPSTHVITFSTSGSTLAAGEVITYNFDPGNTGTGFLMTEANALIANVEVTIGATAQTVVSDTGVCSAGVNNVAISAASEVLTVELCATNTGGTTVILDLAETVVTNPTTTGSYEIRLDTTADTGAIEVPIIDDDTVNIEGYIDTTLTFDIDTATGAAISCDAAGGANPCDTHGGAGNDNVGYVVDLGEMSTDYLSQSQQDRLHADGNTGVINSIYFDLSTNAAGGAIITASSLNNGRLVNGTHEIPAVTDGNAIAQGDGLYGYQMPNAATTTTGAIDFADACDDSAAYCGFTTTPKSIIDTNDVPVFGSRSELQIAAAPDTADGTGTYTDEITFIATSTF